MGGEKRLAIFLQEGLIKKNNNYNNKKRPRFEWVTEKERKREKDVVYILYIGGGEDRRRVEKKINKSFT